MTLLGSKDLPFASFLAGLLEPDPTRRLTPVQALRHTFLAPLFPFRFAIGPDSPAAAYPSLPVIPAAPVWVPVAADPIRCSAMVPSCCFHCDCSLSVPLSLPAVALGDTFQDSERTIIFPSRALG